MNLKVLIAGCLLEFGYLMWLIVKSLSSISISPLFIELASHGLFQVVVLTIILIGAFVNGKK